MINGSVFLLGSDILIMDLFNVLLAVELKIINQECRMDTFKVEVFKQGEQYKFALGLDAKYGEGTAEHLEGLARTTIKISRIDYEEKISYYKATVEKLKKKKGIE